jgi:CheY-like chemotaxis protein
MPYLNPILLADDDDDDRMFFENAVRETDSNLKVITYADGFELVRKISSVGNPGILFLDINMPKMNGLQCLLELRRQGKYDTLPIVIFSTSASYDLINKFYDAGANAFIVKPNDFNQWRSIIGKAISQGTEQFFKNTVNEFENAYPMNAFKNPHSKRNH